MKKLLALLTIVFLISGCSDDGKAYPDTLTGEWSLVKVMENTDAGEIIEIPEDDILWTFDTQTNQLTIVNTSVEYPGLPVAEGSYTYTLYDNPVQTETGWNYKIDIDGVTGFFYDLSGIHLQLSDGQANGYHYDLIRPISVE
ncbi:membrane lipoprotein lipid attachment site-containing protein [Flavobacterium silvaticum]|uniref:Lipocalin-like domain-containing protein n=1 Tax=Flavobacterium silvaticum TaxID=1852020 RepID=A0A972JFF3_9FLAO|nr:membrane lipoprotein lipid attachment site-containing protein [Flavobacterium silvaticum]NMH27899.1 hypothetical protein [Flavobacterium silvaticum]